jgi:prepilin-type N-terminal cleavage/methylation domain-containing protein
MRGRRGARGFGLVEILIVLVVVAVAGAVLYQYFASTTRTVEKMQQERPLATAKVAADQASLGTIRSALQMYHAQHDQWPADKAAVLALLPGPPRFQCAGSDFEYDPTTGEVRLLSDPARC